MKQLYPHWGGKEMLDIQSYVEYHNFAHGLFNKAVNKRIDDHINKTLSDGVHIPWPTPPGKGKTEEVRAVEWHGVTDLPSYEDVAAMPYDEKWKTKVGKDSIDLCANLPKWLGKRLINLGMYTMGHPLNYRFNEWRSALVYHGRNLVRYSKAVRGGDVADKTREAAKESLHWVADNFDRLWD